MIPKRSSLAIRRRVAELSEAFQGTNSQPLNHAEISNQVRSQPGNPGKHTEAGKNILLSR